MLDKCLQGKIAVITGATRGIGLAIARAFVKAGAEVWINGYERGGAAMAAEINARFVLADLADPAGVDLLAETVSRDADRIDILVNNAGIETPMPVETVSTSVLDRIWAVNARAPVQLTQAFLPLLKASGAASVVNVTSIHSATPYAGNIAYCMSKAALDMATKVMAIELAPFGIRVNNLAPGAIETDINREVLDHIGRDRFREWIPAGRVGTVAEVVGPAIFLASSASSYVTGTTLIVDGAYSQHLVRYRPDAID